MDQVADTVSLPHLDDSQVQEGVLDARREKNQTISDLNEFDATQTNRLMPVSDQLRAMEQWISQIESLFQNGLTDVDFPAQQWAAVTARAPLQLGLAHQSPTMDSVSGLNGMENPQNVLYNGRNLGSSTLEGITPESLMTAPNTAIGNSTEKPEAESENGFLKAAKDFADTMLFDDLKTITDKDSSLLQKGIAIFGMTPMGKGVKVGKLGFKLIRESPIATWTVKKADKLTGPVEVKAPPNATIEQIEQVKSYVDGANKALLEGALSPTGRVSTKGKLRRDASRAARIEAKRAAENGTPYKGHVGHVPDTTWVGKPSPHSWLDLDPKVNMSLGGQANKYPLGYKPTEFNFVKENLKDE